MTKHTITISGTINKKGEHGFYNLNKFTDWAKNFKGKDTLVTFEILDEDKRKRLLANYHAHILPEWQFALYKQQGEIKNIQQTNEHLLFSCPITQQKSLSELNLDELCMFLDFVRYKSLEEINLVVDDWRII